MKVRSSMRRLVRIGLLNSCVIPDACEVRGSIALIPYIVVILSFESFSCRVEPLASIPQHILTYDSSSSAWRETFFASTEEANVYIRYLTGHCDHGICQLFIFGLYIPANRSFITQLRSTIISANR